MAKSVGEKIKGGGIQRESKIRIEKKSVRNGKKQLPLERDE